jgi:hypothetical protein
VKYLDNISDTDIVELNIPTGVPLVYELDDDLKPIRNYYLGDQAAIAAAMQAVANQGKANRYAADPAGTLSSTASSLAAIRMRIEAVARGPRSQPIGRATGTS